MAYYFENNPNTISNEKTIKANINNNSYIFKTDNDVFSKKGLDFGTRALLETINFNEINGLVLDMGCGYGPIGIIISKLSNANVDMVDINCRAIKLAKKNATLNKANVNVLVSDRYTNISKKYNYIISNPPIRVGKKILYEILFSAKEYLEKNGTLIFVINKDQGAKSVIKDLEKEYSVRILKKSKGFYVISCQNC